MRVSAADPPASLEMIVPQRFKSMPATALTRPEDTSGATITAAGVVSAAALASFIEGIVNGTGDGEL